MHERLVELWLDSANERAYQPAFVQMLVGLGHRIVHSTRHGPLEFGKDVMAVSPDGIPCAYQLKGNPGGRLNRAQFREIQPQLHELVATAIIYPGAPEIHHQSYLVTNGLIEEDVILLIRQMNETWRKQGFGVEPLRVLTRGDLLAMVQAAGATIWPFSLKGIEGVIAMLGYRGDAQMPLPILGAILSDIYQLELEDLPLARPELERRLPVAALFVSISLRNFAGRSNHFAILSAWVLYFSYTIAALERHDAFGCGEGSLSAACDAVFAALAALTTEAVGREQFTEGQTWTDTEFVPVRTALVNAMMAIHSLWIKTDGAGTSGTDDASVRLRDGLAERGLWGEGAIPQLLAHFWYLTSELTSDVRAACLASLFERVVVAQTGHSELLPLPPPYYSADEAILHRNQHLLPGVKDPIENDYFVGKSFTAMGLLYLAVQAGAKSEAAAIWPHYTRLIHRSFRPAAPWQFCLFRCSQGLDKEVIVPPGGDWAQLRSTALDPSIPGVPQRLAASPLMLLLFIIICPHRMTPEVTRYLGLRLGTPVLEE